MKLSSPTTVVLVYLFVAGGLCAQQPAVTREHTDAAAPIVIAAEPASPTALNTSPAQRAVVPRLIKFNGTLRDLAGKPITGPVDVTFCLYFDEAGGVPLWFETQTVQANSLGRYSVLLG